ncbi:hypothetical protein HF086_018468 [Spodoptera exigua]|uniref:Uncharacterized protein n=1 Tax=Spodoptera exigua TaxID=7107 RepID=A0A922M525_SPOEX|nr:hypothetical protein HF086_018468 [Spodoptera exigua]
MIVVPRSRLPAEAVAQEAVMVALYHFFCLVIAECGGTEQLVRCVTPYSLLNQILLYFFAPNKEDIDCRLLNVYRSAGGADLETRVMPCCCWPCCVIPRPKLHK